MATAIGGLLLLNQIVIAGVRESARMGDDPTESLHKYGRYGSVTAFWGRVSLVLTVMVLLSGVAGLVFCLLR